MYNVFTNNSCKLGNLFDIYSHFIALLLFGCCNTGQNNELKKVISISHNVMNVHSTILLQQNLDWCQTITPILFFISKALHTTHQFSVCIMW